MRPNEQCEQNQAELKADVEPPGACGACTSHGSGFPAGCSAVMPGARWLGATTDLPDTRKLGVGCFVGDATACSWVFSRSASVLELSKMKDQCGVCRSKGKKQYNHNFRAALRRIMGFSSLRCLTSKWSAEQMERWLSDNRHRKRDLCGANQ